MSARQELRDFAESGRLRQQLEGHLSCEATELAVEVVRRYCEPRRPSRKVMLKRRARWAAKAGGLQ